MYYPSQQRQHGTKSMFKTTQSFTKLCIKPCILPKGKEKKPKKRKGGLAIKIDTQRVGSNSTCLLASLKHAFRSFSTSMQNFAKPHCTLRIIGQRQRTALHFKPKPHQTIALLSEEILREAEISLTIEFQAWGHRRDYEHIITYKCKIW